MKNALALWGLLALSVLLTGCFGSGEDTGGNAAEPIAEIFMESTEEATDKAQIEPQTSNDTHPEPAVISPLEAALLSHGDVIEAAPFTIPPWRLAPLIANIESEGWEHTDFVLYSIRYKSDGYEVMGFVSAPTGFYEREHPILIYNRGGNRDMGMLEPEWMAMLAMRGYIVLGSQYRGVAGGTGMEQFGGDEINDVLKLIDIGQSFEFARQGGVYMLGRSRGGMMTYIASRLDSRINAAAVWAAVSNSFESFYERDDQMQQVYLDLIGGTPETLPEEFERRSPVLWANEIKAPLLIGHGGEADWRVPTHHAVNMAAALAAHDMPHKLVIYPDGDHGIPAEFVDEMDEWFRLHPASE